MKKALIACAAIGALFAGSASAADMAVKAPMLKAPAPVYSWTGCYLSAGGGYGMYSQEHTISSTPAGGLVPNTVEPLSTTAGGRGWLGRFGGGCDYQLSGGLSNWVIGAFGDYDWMSLKGSFATQLTNAAVGPTMVDEKESGAWSAGARIGYTITPTILTYFDGGWTQTRFDQMNVFGALNGIATGNAFPAHTYSGWFIGSGFEYNFSWLPIPGLFLKTEYRYSTYRRDDLTEFVIATGAPAGNAGLGNVLHADKQVQTVTTSLVWRFNWGSPVVAKY
jgi:outer membrane immunogenic protein